MCYSHHKQVHMFYMYIPDSHLQQSACVIFRALLANVTVCDSELEINRKSIVAWYSIHT